MLKRKNIKKLKNVESESSYLDSNHNNDINSNNNKKTNPS